MRLDYLDFEFSDEETGHGSFDAMASVTAERLPALRAEIDSVLAWANEAFGASASLEDGGEWDFELQRTDEPVMQNKPGTPARTTMTLTLGGSPGFCDAFRDNFEIDA